MITVADARTLLNDYMEEAPSRETEVALDSIVPNDESRDFYMGMITALMLVHEALEGGDAETIRQALPTFRLVAGRAANYVVD